MSAEVIFEYHSFREFLRRLYEEKKERNPKFSLRSWSKKLKLRSPSLLISSLNGTRKIPMSLVERIAADIELSGLEKEWFYALVYLERAEGAIEKETCIERLARLKSLRAIT